MIGANKERGYVFEGTEPLQLTPCLESEYGAIRINKDSLAEITDNLIGPVNLHGLTTPSVNYVTISPRPLALTYR